MKNAMIFNQHEFALRCEWGKHGIQQLAPISQVIVIVDVLSFSTCVEIATRRGAVVFPYRWKDASALEYAQSLNAELASLERRVDRPSLSPTSLTQIFPGTRLVLPSQNGSVLTLETGSVPTVIGCLRNCAAIARFVQSYQEIAVIPAGEQWQDGSLRPALEDWLGAGAILSHLKGTPSPEAEAAIVAFQQANGNLSSVLKNCSSGKELIARGFEADVELATLLNVSQSVPQLIDRAFIISSQLEV